MDQLFKNILAIIVKPVYADIKDFNVSNAYNPAKNIQDRTISGILTGGGINLLNLLFFFVGLAFFASLIMAAYNMVLNQGSPDKISAAQSRITNSLIGILVTFASFLIVRLITAMFGYSDILPF